MSRDKEHATWNCKLWINNDEGLYNLAVSFMQERKAYGSGRNTWRDFLDELEQIGLDKTPDGVAWTDADDDEMDEMLSDLVSELIEI